ncbi:hypothetical protein F4861DRAFT_107695 [Xylaria intraflava]|nr:hypothetical protein F4861DRAFT_107695 [Xylaria intraflava]
MPPSSNDAGQQADPGPVGSIPNTNPVLPASPTLTNPDMILPDYDDGSISLDRSHSPFTMWKNTHIPGMEFDPSGVFTAGPIAPSTPIIYGNGTMLSDIGEVTEVESTYGPGRSRSGSAPSEFAIVTSTALQYEAIKQKINQARMAHQRHASVESSSTITGHDQAGVFADFDDSVSIDDSNFQGDDEESVADSYVEDIADQGSLTAKKPSFNPADERYSSPLSRRAELILANAKRRLSTMEGNLHRARSSLNSPALSSMGSYSTPSPSIGRPATAISYGRDDNHRNLPYGHNRISSESNIPAENKTGMSTPRASSALGTAGGYRRPLLGPQIRDRTQKRLNGTPSPPLNGNASSNGKISLHEHDRSLEPLSEDGSLEQTASRLDTDNAGADTYLNPMGLLSNKDPKRPASSTQVRDLKDQVNDLKGRLSTLRDQARADSLERRSLQSLRTPSPFTHARVETWYTDTSSHEDDITVSDDSNGHTPSDNNASVLDRRGGPAEADAHPRSHDEPQAIQPIPAEEITVPGTSTSADSQRVSPTPPADTKMDQAEPDIEPLNQADDFDDMRTEDGYEFAEADDFDESASESGASSYHDTVQVQVSHEDREDAFDYEHFFLHSAMGSMSRRRMRRHSNDSFSSEDSVETTRGPITSQSMDVATTTSGLRSRRGSAGSTSTMDSFATATEGRRTRVGITASDEYNDEYNDQYLERVRNLPKRSRTHTPNAARRMVYTPDASSSGPGSKGLNSSLRRRPQSSAAALQNRSSISSLSTAANRSFPLNNQSQEKKGVLTPDGSPDQELKQISETLMNETASICEKAGLHDGETVAPMKMLQKDDQILVERLVASLGRCVLGLSEAGRASAESRAYRRKIETARRILEGFE